MVSLAPPRLSIVESTIKERSFFSLLLFCFADFVFTFLQFVRIPQNSASKLMAPKFSSHPRRRRRRGRRLGASRVESVIHTRRQGVECSAEYRICPITVIRHCHSRHWTLPGALSGGGALLISNSQHSRGLYMNFEYLIAKVSQKEKDRGERERGENAVLGVRLVGHSGDRLSRSVRPCLSGPLSLSLSIHL